MVAMVAVEVVMAVVVVAVELGYTHKQEAF
jgi:hypothetical protein